MISDLFYILNEVREKIFERFILPGLNISYWSFLIWIAIIGMVITLLVNSVRAGRIDKDSPKGSKQDKKSNRFNKYNSVKSYNHGNKSNLGGNCSCHK